MQIRHVPLSLLATSLVLNIRSFNTFLSLIKLVHVSTRVFLPFWNGSLLWLINKWTGGNYFVETIVLEVEKTLSETFGKFERRSLAIIRDEMLICSRLVLRNLNIYIYIYF